jgi:hypothetical protein
MANMKPKSQQAKRFKTYIFLAGIALIAAVPTLYITYATWSLRSKASVAECPAKVNHLHVTGGMARFVCAFFVK